MTRVGSQRPPPKKKINCKPMSLLNKTTNFLVVASVHRTDR